MFRTEFAVKDCSMLEVDRISVSAPNAELYLSRFSLGGQSFDWRLATIAGMEVAKLVPWNSSLN